MHDLARLQALFDEAVVLQAERFEAMDEPERAAPFREAEAALEETQS